MLRIWIGNGSNIVALKLQPYGSCNYMYTHTYAYVHMCTYVYTHACVHVRVYAYTYVRIHARGTMQEQCKLPEIPTVSGFVTKTL